MRLLLSIVSLLTLVAVVPAFGDDAPAAASADKATADTAVSVSQLQIKKKTADDLQVNLFGNEGIRFVLVLTQPDQMILGVDEEASKVVSAVDGKGNDLTEDGGHKWINAFFSKISSNRHKIAIPAEFITLPAPGTTTIHLKANVVLYCGGNEKTQEIKPFEIAKGLSTTISKHSLEIKAQESGFVVGQDKDKIQCLGVTLGDKGVWVKSIDFIDDAGKVIKTREDGSSGGGNVVEKSFTIDKDIKSLGIRVVYFDTIQDVTRPIDLRLGVGLP